jgi:hypothetical protein
MNSTSSSRVGFIGLGGQGGPMARRIKPIADVAAAAAAEAERDTSEPGDGGHRDAGHGDGERGATLLAAADAALALMNVART